MMLSWENRGRGLIPGTRTVMAGRHLVLHGIKTNDWKKSGSTDRTSFVGQAATTPDLSTFLQHGATRQCYLNSLFKKRLRERR
jgi:hypothetical protein